MSNVFTDAVRVYARDDHQICPLEAEWISWMLLGAQGSYWVPVCIRIGPAGRYVDIQYGSGKSPDIVYFCDRHAGYWPYRTIWGRRFDEGSDQDQIWQDNLDAEGLRYCRYGFDEVHVLAAGDLPPVELHASWQRHGDASWRLSVAGSYRTGNARWADVGRATPSTALPTPDPAALVTPTTPNEQGEALTGIDPPWLAPLADECPNVTLIEFFWRGRLVHRAREDDAGSDGRMWQHRCADDWDNCLDPAFLRFTGATELAAPDEVYERDQKDWNSRPGWS